jgi:twitching motility protein PilT
MSNLVRLFEVFGRMPADEVRLEVGEAPFIVSEGERRVIGAAALNARQIFAIAAEAVPHDELRELPTHRPRVVRQTHGTDTFIIEIGRSMAGLTIAIRRARAATSRIAMNAMSASSAMASVMERNMIEASDLEEVPLRQAVGAPPMRAQARHVPASLSLPPAPKLASVPPAARREAAPRLASVPPIARAPRLRSVPPPRELDCDLEREPERARDEHRSHRRERFDSEIPAVLAPRAASGPKKIDALLRRMIAAEASDLHLSAGNSPVMRVHGEIRFGDAGPLSSGDIEAMAREIMPAKASADWESLRDADFAYEVPGLARFRVNVFEDRNGTGAVLRQIPIDIRTVEDLGLPKACLDLCWLSKGLVVVTGPTGSGKSTTLAAMIDYINKNRSDHIITIEDPVEFVHTNKKCLVNQREVGQNTKSFKNALRAALREDPDIVLVVEMRDLETIAIAIETAETGHLVFGTLHTTTAVSTVDRIIDQFPSDRQAQIRVMLSESLKGVVAQGLCKKIGGGRVAAHEILLGTSAVSALVRDGKTFQLPSVMQTAKGQGMVTMNDSLFSLVQRKVVEPKEAWLKAVDKAGLLAMFKGAGLPTSFA